MKIEFDKSKGWFKTDNEIVDYAMQYIDVATKEESMDLMEIIEDLQDKFEMTDSEMAACIFTLGVYTAKNVDV